MCPHLNLAPQKTTAKILSVGFFVVPASTNAGKSNCKEKKKKRRRGRETKKKSCREQIKAFFVKTLNLFFRPSVVIIGVLS